MLLDLYPQWGKKAVKIPKHHSHEMDVSLRDGQITIYERSAGLDLSNRDAVIEVGTRSGSISTSGRDGSITLS